MFTSALNKYRNAKALEPDAAKAGDADFDRATDRTLLALSALLDIPAPDIAAVLVKFDIVREEFAQTIPEEEADALRRDLVRLRLRYQSHHDETSPVSATANVQNE